MSVYKVGNVTPSDGELSVQVGGVVVEQDGELTPVEVRVHDIRSDIAETAPLLIEVPLVSRALIPLRIEWYEVSDHQLAQGITAITLRLNVDLTVTPHPNRSEVLTVDGIAQVVPHRFDRPNEVLTIILSSDEV